jgi:hypothetical protein
MRGQRRSAQKRVRGGAADVELRRTRFGRARERCGKAEVSDAELLCKDRWRVAGLLREMQEHGGVDPDYSMVIFGGAGVAVSKMQLRCSTKCWPREK